MHATSQLDRLTIPNQWQILDQAFQQPVGGRISPQNQVVPIDRLDETVEEWVSDILRCSPLAVRATKQAAMCGLDHPLPQAFYTAYPADRLRQKSEDAYEGPRAFAEKRPPNWTGR